MKKEIWKEISGYEGCYEVSSIGRVRKLPRIMGNSIGRVVGGRLLKQRKMKTVRNNGKHFYHRMAVDLSGENGEGKTFFVGKLVATAFVSNPENKSRISYKDFNSLNNNADNLIWATGSEIMQRASKNNRWTIKGRNHGLAKKVRQFYESGRYKRTFHCITEASDITKISRTCIQECLSGEQKTAGGFIWKY